MMLIVVTSERSDILSDHTLAVLVQVLVFTQAELIQVAISFMKVLWSVCAAAQMPFWQQGMVAWKHRECQGTFSRAVSISKLMWLLLSHFATPSENYIICISAYFCYRDGLFICCYDVFYFLVFTNYFQIWRKIFVHNVKPDPEIEVLVLLTSVYEACRSYNEPQNVCIYKSYCLYIQRVDSKSMEPEKISCV